MIRETSDMRVKADVYMDYERIRKVGRRFKIREDL